MYLADSMRLLASGLGGNTPMANQQLGYLRKRCEDTLERAELYAFTRSAMDMAADLVIDTPERLERVAASVLERPRHLFVEAPYRERCTAFSRMRGFSQVEKEEDRFDPKRIGLDIQCHGDGKARVGVIWNFPKTSLGKLNKSLAAMNLNRVEKDALREALHFGIAYAFLDIDLGKRDELSRADFLDGRSSNPKVREFMRMAEASDVRMVEQISGDVRKRKRIESEAWRLYRLNSMAAASVDPEAALAAAELSSETGQLPEQIREAAIHDLDGEIIYCIAFLAALDAGGDSLAREERPAKPARRASPVAHGDLAVDRMSVLTMDISGRPLSPRRAGEGTEAKGTGSPRAHHPVQGHLFLARNGKLTYRRPHWRGSLEVKEKRIHRVV